MKGERRQRRRTSKARLLAGVAMAAAAPLAWASVAAAQDAATLPADGLSPQALYLEADTASRTGDVISAAAEGDARVLARARGHTLRAREVTYDLTGGVATATGNVELTTPNGEVAYASHLETQPDFDIGVAVDFATRLQNGASLMAATAVRRSEQVNELNYALFTPCPICDENGPRTPSIAIQAERVTQSEELRAILYRNAVFRVGGVPVLYLPFFSHPDPSVDRASGFLIPSANYDEGRGLSVEVPYLLVVSPSQDWLISPQINTRIAPLLNFQWRRRFNDGLVVARGGYTWERNFGDFDLDGDGEAESNVKYGDRDHRGYLLAWGRFDPEGPWRWGFTAERTSDKTLFDRYDVADPYQENGLYYGDQRRLINQLYVERQTERSYLSVAAFTFQSLRLDPAFAEWDFRDPATGFKVFEDDDTLPIVGPLVNLRWELPESVLGGRLRLTGSAVALYRSDYVGAPVLRPEVVPAVTTGLGGVDSRRVSARIDWRTAVITGAGLRIEPFVDGRADAYSIGDLPPMFAGGEDDILTRGRFTAGVDVTYPLIRRFTDGSDMILEPMLQLSASTRSDLDPRIPIEDSQTVEMDAVNLFRIDRFPGYDLYEGGLRFTAGARATYRWGEGRSASLFVGRSLRDAEEPAFLVPIPDAPARLYDPTGLAGEVSDWVVQGEMRPTDRIRAWGHATIDGEGELQRAEAVIDAGWGRRNLASLSYIIDRSNPVEGPLDRGYQFVELSGQQFVWGSWGFTVAGVADLERDEITRSEAGLLFDDDCFRFEIGYRRDNTRVRPTGPSEGVYVRLNLATFGGSGYGRDGQR